MNLTIELCLLTLETRNSYKLSIRVIYIVIPFWSYFVSKQKHNTYLYKLTPGDF